MTTLLWDSALDTGFSDIDEQHKRLLGILDRLAASARLGHRMSPDELEAVIAELAEYAQTHFDTEVRLMLDTDCDLRHVQKHVREHEDFIRHISLVHEALVDSRNDEGANLARYLSEWFSRHIVGSDLAMARQVMRIRDGMSPQLAYDAEFAANDRLGSTRAA